MKSVLLPARVRIVPVSAIVTARSHFAIRVLTSADVPSVVLLQVRVTVIVTNAAVPSHVSEKIVPTNIAFVRATENAVKTNVPRIVSAKKTIVTVNVTVGAASDQVLESFILILVF
jgi:hypothetical protein